MATSKQSSTALPDFSILKLEEVYDHQQRNSLDGIFLSNAYTIIYSSDEHSMSHFLDFEKYTLKKGSLLLVSKEQLVGFEIKASVQGYLIQFNDDFILTNLSSDSEKIANRIFNYSIYSPLIESTNEDELFIHRLLSQVETEDQNEDQHYNKEIAYAMLQTFLLYILRVRTNSINSLHQKYYDDFIKFQLLLKINATQHRNVQFYADQLELPLKRINFICKTVSGKSTKDFINSTITLLIKRKLLLSTQSINEISTSFNFDETTNFIKFFKKQSGLTPAAFRKDIQGINND